MDKFIFNKNLVKLDLHQFGPQKQNVFVQRSPVTFKNSQTVSKRVYFTNYFDWMGEIREFGALPVMSKLVRLFETGQWGMITNSASVNILGELRGKDVVETRFWIENVSGEKHGTLDLCFEWYRWEGDRRHKKVAMGKQRVTWVRITGHGTVIKEAMPGFFYKFIHQLKPPQGMHFTDEGEHVANVWAGRWEIVLDWRAKLRGAPLLRNDVFSTTIEDSNLVGNIYFSNYPKWLGRVCDSYFYGIIPQYYKNGNGEFVCGNCQINFLGEAMPFDKILVKMYLSAVYECGVDINFEFYLIDNDYIRHKLAYAQFQAAWVTWSHSKGRMVTQLPLELMRIFKRLK